MRSQNKNRSNRSGYFGTHNSLIRPIVLQLDDYFKFHLRVYSTRNSHLARYKSNLIPSDDYQALFMTALSFSRINLWAVTRMGFPAALSADNPEYRGAMTTKNEGQTPRDSWFTEERGPNIEGRLHDQMAPGLCEGHELPCWPLY